MSNYIGPTPPPPPAAGPTAAAPAAAAGTAATAAPATSSGSASTQMSTQDVSQVRNFTCVEMSQTLEFNQENAARGMGEYAHSLAARRDSADPETAASGRAQIQEFCRAMRLTSAQFDALLAGDLELSPEQMRHVPADLKQMLSNIGDPNASNEEISCRLQVLQARLEEMRKKGESC